MEQSTTPINIDVDNENQQLEIHWADGHTSTYPLFGLRKNCPCVSCRGGHEKMNQFEPEAFFIKNPPTMDITNIKQVGNHAIQIFWLDGHNSGMYRWETLRELDPQNHKPKS
jgi:DUF971 family protein